MEKVVGREKKRVSIKVPEFGEEFLLDVDLFFFNQVYENFLESFAFFEDYFEHAQQVEVLLPQKHEGIRLSKLTKLDGLGTASELFDAEQNHIFH